MANYNPSLTTAIGVGQQVVLSNAALTGSFTTQAVAVGRDAAQPPLLTVFNTSAATATVQVAAVDADANYVALTNANTGEAVTIAATSAGNFTSIGPFVRLKMSASPGTSVVTIAR